jgi:hypothetical protein
MKQKAWMKKHQRRLLDNGKIEGQTLTLRAIGATNPEVAEKIRIEADYFQRNTSTCATQSSAASTCLPARMSSKQDARP